MKYFIRCMTKDFANFKGRARRREYCMFNLFAWPLLIGAGGYCVYVAESLEAQQGNAEVSMLTVMLPFLIVFAVTIIPFYAVTVRRLHDLGLDGSNCFNRHDYGLMIKLFCKEGDAEPNEYGESPK